MKTFSYHIVIRPTNHGGPIDEQHIGGVFKVKEYGIRAAVKDALGIQVVVMAEKLGREYDRAMAEEELCHSRNTTKPPTKVDAKVVVTAMKTSISGEKRRGILERVRAALRRFSGTS
jgi:hypothetical protein